MFTIRRIAIGLTFLLLGQVAAMGVHLYREGYRAYIIHTGSMTGTYNSGGLVIDRPASASPLEVGQTITYVHPGTGDGSGSDEITHRIVGLKHGTIQTKGDANQIRDTWNTRPSQVQGVVVHYLPYMGYVVYFLKHRTGDASVATGLLTAILLWDLFFATPLGAQARRVDDELEASTDRMPHLPISDDAAPLAPLLTGYDRALQRLRRDDGVVASL